MQTLLGHSYPEPTVRFEGSPSEGFRALSVAMSSMLPVADLRRVWYMQDGEPTGPVWELSSSGGEFGATTSSRPGPLPCWRASSPRIASELTDGSPRTIPRFGRLLSTISVDPQGLSGTRKSLQVADNAYFRWTTWGYLGLPATLCVQFVWYYQHLNDDWDLDHPFERLLVDTAVAPDPDAVAWINPRLQPGEERRVMTGIPGKTGVVYTLDRETGEFLWANPTVAQNVITHIDGATGDVTENPEVLFSALGQERLACPSWAGGKDWEAGAYSPLTHTMYFPLRNACQRLLSTTEGGSSTYMLAARHQLAAGTDQLGTVRAIAVDTGATRWLHEQRAATMSLVATGGRLLFGGDANGRFRAFDQDAGAVLWEINLGSPVSGYPVTFAVDGRQYVAVGTGTSANASINLRMTPELRPSFGNNLFVFTLPE